MKKDGRTSRMSKLPGVDVAACGAAALSSPKAPAERRMNAAQAAILMICVTVARRLAHNLSTRASANVGLIGGLEILGVMAGNLGSETDRIVTGH